MKTYIPLVMILVASLLGGCATNPQMTRAGRDVGSVLDRPETAAIVGAVLGGVADKNVFGGDGRVGAALGGTTGWAVGRARQTRSRTFIDAQTRCSVRQSGYYEGPNSFVVTSEARECDSVTQQPGFRNYPDSKDVTVRYDLRAPTPSSSPASTGSCMRYMNGVRNPDC
jgi:uncharacterized protein YcfJ